MHPPQPQGTPVIKDIAGPSIGSPLDVICVDIGRDGEGLLRGHRMLKSEIAITGIFNNVYSLQLSLWYMEKT
jgi:hypothetical protein